MDKYIYQSVYNFTYKVYHLKKTTLSKCVSIARAYLHMNLKDLSESFVSRLVHLLYETEIKTEYKITTSTNVKKFSETGCVNTHTFHAFSASLPLFTAKFREIFCVETIKVFERDTSTTDIGQSKHLLQKKMILLTI